MGMIVIVVSDKYFIHIQVLSGVATIDAKTHLRAQTNPNQPQKIYCNIL
jgi:hypothetical protein